MTRALILVCSLAACGQSGTTAPRSPAAAMTPSASAGEIAGIEIAAGTRLVLADAARGRELLGQPDAFVDAMSPFDRQARVGSEAAVDRATYLAHVEKNVLGWDETTRGHLEASARELAAAITASGLRLPMPPTIELILTTGDEEVPGAAYTRGRAIVFSRGSIGEDRSGLLAHELFHVITRNAPSLRDELYAAIGFTPIPPLSLPPALESKRATNPDAPVVAHAIRVEYEGRALLATPIILTNRPYTGGTLFEYIAPALYGLDDQGALLLENGAPLSFGFGEAKGFFEQIGRNTQYLIHPEEILAENFRLLLTDPASVSSPDVLERIAAVLGRQP